MNTYLQWARNHSRSIGSAVACSAISSAVTGFIVYKRAELKYRALADEEIQSVKDVFARQRKIGEYSTPEEAVRAAGRDPVSEDEVVEALETYNKALGDNRVVTLDDMKAIVNDNKTDVPQKVSYNNMFDRSDESDGWDLERELELRQGMTHYTISFDEFQANELELEQVQVTYFEGDDVLVDESDSQIEDPLAYLGTNRIPFGRGSKDPNIAYIRNEEIDTEICVVRSEGMYAEIVHGMHISHSADPVRKFRWTDG